jgi:pimeloyl-ACP methyl ester carboxylesterase
VHYEVLGRGRPLIFLHGWVGSWRYWIPVMQAASIPTARMRSTCGVLAIRPKHSPNYTLDQQVS